jgi:hypothetical protein
MNELQPFMSRVLKREASGMYTYFSLPINQHELKLLSGLMKERQIELMEYDLTNA